MERAASESDVGHDKARASTSAPVVPDERSISDALVERARAIRRALVDRFFFAVRIKIVVLLALVGAAMVGWSGVFVFNLYDREIDEQSRTRAEAFTDVLVFALREARSQTDIDGMVMALAGTPRVDLVALVNRDGIVLCASKRDWPAKAKALDAARRSAVDAGSGGLKRVGTSNEQFADFVRPVALPFADGEAAVFIRLDVKASTAILKARAWSILAWLAGAVIVSVLTLSLLMQRFVVQPIEALRDYAERRGGEPPASVENPQDEIAVVARALSDSFRATSATEARLTDLAQKDGLTGLGNWAHFKAHLAREIAKAAGAGEMVGVMILNLDKFKDINDTLGHDSGDAILQRTAEILKGCQRKTDAIARLGADEFGVVISGIETPDDAVEFANRFVRAVGAPFRVGAHELHQTACVGLTLYPQDGRDPDVLLKNADLALSRAKLEGSGACILYRHELHLRAIERNSIERDLRTALAQKQFVLFYQPKVDIRSGRISGAEALIRWQHPERGLVPPDLFIPVAERGGLIGDVTKWVLDEACRQNRAWQEGGLPKIGVAINVSAVDLRRPDLTDTVASTLVRHALSPHFLELEVTESMVMRDVDVVIGTLRRLRSLGVGIGIDDFGTGYSSLAYLKRFPVKRLKIDRSFTRDIADTRDGKIIPKVIIDLAHSLGVDVLAEGVEDAAQLEILRSLGCDEAQGFFLGRPMPAAEFELFLRHAPNGLHPDAVVRHATAIEASSATGARAAATPGSAA